MSSETEPNKSADAGAGPVSLPLLATVASDTWRIVRLSRRTFERLAPSEAARAQNQLRFLEKNLETQFEQVGIRVVNLEGQFFDPGIAATVLNADEFSAQDELIVTQMIEPIVMGPGGLLKEGVVMLGKVER